MNVDSLLKLIPRKVFNDLAMETQVDFQVKKLKGEFIFKLILFSMLNSDKLSLRVMESFLGSARFKTFSGNARLKSKYNSIRDRICTIDPDYFEKLFSTIFTIYNKHLKEEKSLLKVDSTYVGISAGLFSKGMINGTSLFRKTHVKYSVGLKGSLPCHVRVYTDQSYASEDIALADLIDTASEAKSSVVVFDMGLQSRKALDGFSHNAKMFIGRCRVNALCKQAKQQILTEKPKESTVTITEDKIGYLMNRKNVVTKNRFRLIKGFIDNDRKEIAFVTNMMDEDAYLIAQLYRQRWEIEIFFKFLKQHLNAKHLVSRDMNGIKVMIYMTMILAILILTYKKLNNIKGFKMAKIKFEIDLDNSAIKEIVRLCGGDPKKVSQLWNTS